MRLNAKLLQRRFSAQDQRDFARLSGDANPMHVDAIEARRTLMGAPVVHGVHLVLAALEAICGRRGLDARPMAASARFPRPVLVGERVEFSIANSDAQRAHIEGCVGCDLVLELNVTFGASDPDQAAVPLLAPVPLHESGFDELQHAAGSLPVGIDAALARTLFPCAAANLGLPSLAEVLALTRLVGMRCPGRHSVFGKFEVSFDRSAQPGNLEFRVERADARFSRLEMVVVGARLRGRVRAFLRPPPQRQAAIADVAARIGRDEFAASMALVVGGSRGLGETTAKILAAGGGQVTITYHRGEADAARVAGEIRAWGGRCESVHLDALRPTRTIARIFSGPVHPRTIYYFATPRIFAQRRGFFSRALFQTFIDYYVIGFSALVDAAVEQSAQKLTVFCPSSAALDESVRELTEYCLAKRAGEDLCGFYNRTSEKVMIVSERLPRTKTDQTSTLVDIPAADSLDVMLPIVRHLEGGRMLPEP